MWNVKEGFCTVSKRVPILGNRSPYGSFLTLCPYLYGAGQIEAHDACIFGGKTARLALCGVLQYCHWSHWRTELIWK